MTELSDFQRSNLDKLATYLEALPEDYAHFDMVAYNDDSWLYPSAVVAECGTAACAVGHGPYAGVMPERDESWDIYEARAFCRRCDDVSFMFAWAWDDVDNTHQGAAKRIRYVLKHGGAPEGWGWDEETVQAYQ